MRRPFLLAVVVFLGVFPPASVSVGCSDEVHAPKEKTPLGTALPVSGRAQLKGLTGPVDVVRDAYDMVHIYATDASDAIRVEGYEMAHDRSVQLDLLRRTAAGRMAELFADLSPGLIDSDIRARTLGLRRTAEKIYAALDPNSDEKRWLDAFADGVSQYFAKVAAHEVDIPTSVVGYPQAAFEPWTAIDSLVVGRYQAQEVSFSADADIEREAFLTAAKKAFPTAASETALKKRAGTARDVLRFAPLDPTTVLPEFPSDAAHALSGVRVPTMTAPPERKALDPSILEATKGFREARHFADRFFGASETRGSNNWAVAPSRSATGRPLVASDPHLALSSPAVFWMVHLDVHAPEGGDRSKDMNAAGLAFPGVPGIVLGENEHVAWGATVTYYDVTDVYREKVNAGGDGVLFNGKDVRLERVTETIKIAEKPPLSFDVLIAPQHGPLIPEIVNHAVVAPSPNQEVLSYKWTGFEPSSELSAFMGIMQAKDVEDVRAALRFFEVGAVNWVFGDDSGNIFFSSQARLPKRAAGALAWDPSTYEGTLPMFILPGDGSAEWTGNLEEAFIPHVKNPQGGFVVTANAAQLPVTLDNNPANDRLPSGEPVYLGADFDVGFRAGRITKRLEKLSAATLEDMQSIQADVHSPYGDRLTPQLLLALKAAEEERTKPGTHPDLASVIADARYKAANLSEVVAWLESWGRDSDYAALSGMNPDDNTPLLTGPEVVPSQATLVFATWLLRMGMLTFDDELKVIGRQFPVSVPRVLCHLMTSLPAEVATLDPATADSALFDDLSTKDVVETRNQLAVRALLDALDTITKKLGSDRTRWRWGALHTVRFRALVDDWGTGSLPSKEDRVFPRGYPRPGDLLTVDVATYWSHPGRLDDVDFSYREGPVQRFVADMTPMGPTARNVIPGPEIWEETHPRFRDEAERWRRNQSRPVWIRREDVVKDGKARLLYTPSP